jgi:regulator of replication initiation timing
MTDKTIDLDQHRGMAAQKATELRRMLAEVEENEHSLRLRQDELEAHLLAAPAVHWTDAAEKARYLLRLFATTPAAQDPRRQKLIAAVLADFKRLSGES